MTIENDENFERSTICWIYDKTFVKGEVEVRDHCHITKNYKDVAHRDCYLNVSLNYKNPIVFQNLKNYDAYLILKELGKFELKTSFMLNRLKKYMS